MKLLPITARLFAALLACCAAAPALAQTDSKTCAIVLLHDRGGSPQSLVGFGRKLAATCAARPVEMAWSQRRANDKDLPGSWQEIAKHVKDLRQQGYTRVMVGGFGFGANAALAYTEAVGELDGVVALAPQADAPGIGPLPKTAAGLRQHVPALWVIGTEDPLHERGEAFAYAKAPPHPSSQYVSVKADRRGTPDAAVKPVLDWLKSFE